MSRERIPAVQPEAERALLERSARLERRLGSLEAKPLEQPFLTADFVAREGQTLFVEAPTAGIAGLLPAPRPQNRAAQIVLAFTTANPVTLTCPNGTVNGAASLTSRAVGTYAAVCDGVNGWFVAPIIDAGASLSITGGVLDYVGSTSNMNSATTSGDLNIVDVSGLECGGVLSYQSVSETNIDGFTVKPAGFWFVLNVRDATTTNALTLIENNGNTTTSIRCPAARDFRMSKNDSVIVVSSNGRWRVVATLPKLWLPVSDSVTWAAQQDNYSRTSRNVSGIRATLTGNQTLTGVVPDTSAANGGEILPIENIDTVDTLTIAHDATSTAANRFLCPAAANYSQGPLTSTLWRYDSTSSRWRMLAHS